MDSEGEPPRFYDDPTSLPHQSISDVWHRSFWSYRTDRNAGSDASSSISSSSSASSASGNDGQLSSDASSATWSGSDGKRWIMQNPDFRKLIRSNDATSSAASSGMPGVGFGRSVSLSHDMSAVGRFVKSTKHEDVVQGRVERRHKLSVVGEDPSSPPISATDYRQGPAAAITERSSEAGDKKCNTLQTGPNLVEKDTGMISGRPDGAGKGSVSGGLIDALHHSAAFTIGKPEVDLQDNNSYTFLGLPRQIKVSRRELNMMTPSSF